MIEGRGVHTESGFPLSTRNYKISATVGVTTVIKTLQQAILYTGAGQKLILEEVLPEDWSRYRVADTPLCNIVGTRSKRIRQNDFITSFVQVGNLRTQARFIMVHSLVAECILGCHFIDRHVR
jgi:hypothetical protein